MKTAAKSLVRISFQERLRQGGSGALDNPVRFLQKCGRAVLLPINDVAMLKLFQIIQPIFILVAISFRWENFTDSGRTLSLLALQNARQLLDTFLYSGPYAPRKSIQTRLAKNAGISASASSTGMSRNPFLTARSSRPRTPPAPTAW